jgi:GNAT superfamily N-acetyltransferase
MSTVRSAAADDEPALRALVAEFPTPTQMNKLVFSETLRAKLADPHSCTLVLEHDGRLVGYLSGHCHDTFYAAGPTAWVDEVLVSKEFRGQGHGRALMEAFEAWATASGCVLVSLATAGAAAFYEHLGYATKAAYYKKYLAAAGKQ